MKERIEIEVNRLRLFARHGVFPSEQSDGNTFEVWVRLTYPASGAVATDDLASTLNYAEAVATIKEVMATPSALIEHVCGRIRDALKLRFPDIESGYVKVAKLNPPIPAAELESVAVALSW